MKETIRKIPKFFRLDFEIEPVNIWSFAEVMLLKAFFCKWPEIFHGRIDWNPLQFSNYLHYIFTKQSTTTKSTNYMLHRFVISLKYQFMQ